MLRLANSHPSDQSRSPRPSLNPQSSAGRFNLFALLPQDVAEAFVAASHPRTVSDGHIIYQQDDIGTAMYRIVSGLVRLSFLHPDGRELVFITFEPGDCFGIITLIDGEPHLHTAEAHGQVRLQVVSSAAFAALRSKHRELDEAILQLFCRHMRALSTHVVDATLNDLPIGLARRLLEVARPGDDLQPIIHLSQAELALLFGVSRQTINKLLNQFEDEGLVRLTYGSVILQDIGGLQRQAAV
jgi:CRP/FNR family cyclic AMP-dependent transcriptional regulator